MKGGGTYIADGVFQVVKGHGWAFGEDKGSISPGLHISSLPLYLATNLIRLLEALALTVLGQGENINIIEERVEA